MSLERVTLITGGDEPQLPVKLEEVKSHLRITEDHEDELLRIYLRAAVELVEQTTRRAVANRDYLVQRDSFPAGEWHLPLGRIRSITRIDYLDSDGNSQQWTASPTPWETQFDTDFDPVFRPTQNESWPSTGNFLNSAAIQLKAGWAAADAPFTVRTAILLQVAELNSARCPEDAAKQAPLTSAASVLLHQWELPPWR